MKKVFGIQAEVNVTADEDVVKGIGSGIKNGTIVVADVINGVKPAIVDCITDVLNKTNTKKGE